MRTLAAAGGVADQVGEFELGVVDARALLDAWPDCALILDGRGRICAVNAQLERQFGYARAELIGERLQQLVPDPAQPPIDPLLESAPEMREQLARHKDGRRFPIALRSRAFGDGPSALTLVLLRDESALEAERATLREAIRSQAQLDCAAVTILRLDPSGRITHVNEAWRDFARDNYANDATRIGVGQNYFDVCRRSGEPSALALVDGLRRVLAGQQAVYESIYTAHSPTRLRWFRVNACRPSDGSEALVLTHVDMTSQHLAEARSRIQGCVADAVTTRKPLLTSCRELAYVV